MYQYPAPTQPHRDTIVAHATACWETLNISLSHTIIPQEFYSHPALLMRKLKLDKVDLSVVTQLVKGNGEIQASYSSNLLGLITNVSRNHTSLRRRLSPSASTSPVLSQSP